VLVYSVAIWGGSLQSSYAGELAFGAAYATERSDNITRALPGREIGERTNSSIVGAAYHENSASLVANATVQAEYRDYVKDVYSDGALYYVDAAAVWNILPQQFSWILQERYDYGILDATLPYTPANRTSVNAFETGPELRMALAPRNALIFGLRYGDVHFSNANTNHERHGGLIRWQYEVNSSTSLALNYEHLSLRYEDPVANSDSQRETYYMRYTTREGRSQFLLDLGGVEVTRGGTQTVSGSLVRTSLSRALTSESTLSLLFAGEYTDAGTVLLSTPTASGAGASAAAVPGIATSDLLYVKGGELAYSMLGTVVAINAGYFARDLEYMLAAQDRREAGGKLTITQNPQGITSVGIFGRTQGTTYHNGTDRGDDEREFGARISYRATRELSFILEGKHIRLTSNDANTGYDERRTMLMVQYRTSPLFTPVQGR